MKISIEIADSGIPMDVEPAEDAHMLNSIIRGRQELMQQELMPVPYAPDQLREAEDEYNSYVAAGKAALSKAEIKKPSDPETAASYYEEARNNFIGAIGFRPMLKDGSDLSPCDPKLLVNYGIALDELAASGCVEPYRGKHHATENCGQDQRKRDWEQLASELFQLALEAVATTPIPAPIAEEEVAVTIVAAQKLESRHDPKQAKRLMAEARRNLAIHDTDPRLVAVLDRYTTLDTKRRSQVAKQALHHLVTDSEEALPLAA